MRKLLLCLIVVTPLAGPVRAQAPLNFVQALLAKLELGEPLQTDQAILFPLVVREEPAALGVAANLGASEIAYEEPSKPTRRHGVVARNGGARPVLVIGGTVLEGGTRDRLIARDSIVGPGAAAELRAVPAASSSDVRTEPAAFRASGSLAPLYLRRQAAFSPSDSLVPTFVAHWSDFRNEGDKRRSLIAISASRKLNEHSLRSRERASNLSAQLKDRHVLGGIAAIRGRLQALTLFGSNELLQRYFDPMVAGATYASAAIELAARSAKLPIPGKGDPKKTLEIVTQEARKLLMELARASYTAEKVGAGTLGEVLVMRHGSTRGRAVGLDGRLVHLTVYPYDPVQARIYRAAVDPDAQEKPGKEASRPLDDDEAALSDGLRDRFRRRGRRR
ncbi:MAG: ARPP-1 family domain-containing protein [Planctomycetota bacterium]|jgi:hypothetical protein